MFSSNGMTRWSWANSKIVIDPMGLLPLTTQDSCKWGRSWQNLQTIWRRRGALQPQQESNMLVFLYSALMQTATVLLLGLNKCRRATLQSWSGPRSRIFLGVSGTTSLAPLLIAQLLTHCQPVAAASWSYTGLAPAKWLLCSFRQQR